MKRCLLRRQRHGTPALPRGRSDGTPISHRRHAVVRLRVESVIVALSGQHLR